MSKRLGDHRNSQTKEEWDAEEREYAAETWIRPSRFQVSTEGYSPDRDDPNRSRPEVDPGDQFDPRETR